MQHYHSASLTDKISPFISKFSRNLVWISTAFSSKFNFQMLGRLCLSQDSKVPHFSLAQDFPIIGSSYRNLMYLIIKPTRFPTRHQKPGSVQTSRKSFNLSINIKIMELQVVNTMYTQKKAKLNSKKPASILKISHLFQKLATCKEFCTRNAVTPTDWHQAAAL